MPSSPGTMLPHTSDERTCNNTLRQQYRVLTSTEKAMIERTKRQAQDLLDTIDALPGMYPEQDVKFSIAKTRLEECVMWAVKGITA